MTLRKELFWVITAKLIAIFVLWYLFFSHPVQDHLSTQKLAQHFLQEKENSHGNFE